MNNNQTSKKTAKTVLRALLSAEDIRKLEYIQAVLLCGLPGSGKSTVSRLLETCYGFERFSTDQIRTEELFVGQNHRHASEHDRVMMSRYMVYEELGKRVAKSVAAGKRVLVDGTNMDEKRMGVLGNILAKIPAERVAFITIKPPEWIMRKRFLDEGDEAKMKWWGVYKFWKNYLKEGKASYPTAKTFPRIQIIPIRRYALQTFDWVPDIKAILWDLDGTLYKSIPSMKRDFDAKIIKNFSKEMGLDKKSGEKLFWSRYKILASKTQTLSSTGIDGQEAMTEIANTIDYAKYLKKDKKLIKMITSLKYLKQYILTNANEEVTKKKLQELGLKEEMFDGIMTTYEMGAVKPDLTVFEMAARKARTKPENILSVGDREKTDIVPSKKVGMRTCSVWKTSREADVSLKSVYEVAELFGIEM